MGRGALLAVLLVLGGCSSINAPEGAGDRHSQGCIDEATRPLTAPELTRALKRNGFTVFRIPGDAICEAPAAERMPVSVGNVLFEGPHENIHQHDEITAREGHVFCGLRRAPIWGWKLDEDLDAPAASPIFSGDKATFFFANLECTLYRDGEAETKERQVRNLQNAVRELVALARRKRS